MGRAKFHDEYRDALMKLVERKITSRARRRKSRTSRRTRRQSVKRSISWTCSNGASSTRRRVAQRRLAQRKPKPTCAPPQEAPATIASRRRAEYCFRSLAPTHEPQRIQTQTRLQKNARAGRRRNECRTTVSSSSSKSTLPAACTTTSGSNTTARSKAGPFPKAPVSTRR